MDVLDNNDEIIDFNFWPAFADLMLSLVLIFVFFYVAIDASTRISKRDIESSQMKLICDISNKCGIKQEEVSGEGNEFIIGDGIRIKNEPTAQKIILSDVIFEVNMANLSPEGKLRLQTVGSAIKINLDTIREIQIQAHADRDPIKNDTNLRLASKRATTVYEFLLEDVKINPATHLMSATSFGEYKPVNRPEEGVYDQDRLKTDNATTDMKARNRRIEILLNFKIN